MKVANYMRVSIVLMGIGMFLSSCGGGGTGERSAVPAGLFSGPIADVSKMPPALKAASGAMLVVDNTKGVNFSQFQYEDMAFKSLKVMVLKSAETETDVQCTLVAKDQVRCEQIVYGEDGFVHFFSDAKADQITDTEVTGDMDIRISFHRYVTTDSCGRLVEIFGIAGCDLSFDASLQGEVVSSHFIGTCNTSRNDDKYLEVTVDEDLYKIGVDLGVEFNESAFDINGIVSIDGTNYRYEDIENMDVGVCE